MKKGRKQIVILVIIALALMITSCTSQDIDQPTQEPTEKQVTPVKGGAISLSILSPNHLNPLLDLPEDTYHLMKLIVEPLFSLDETYKIKGVLAEKWNIENQGEKVTINLRKDVYWHDGEPFTAQDVKFTLDALRHKNTLSPYKSYIENISGYHVIDNHTIEISFANGYIGNLEALIFPIMPAHKYNKVEEVMSAHKWSPIGTGPYQLQSIQQNKVISLQSNEKYWGKIPYIDNITAKIMNKRQDLIKSFEAKDVDLFRAINRDWNRYGEDEQLSIYPYDTQKYNFLALNLENELFKNHQVRKALQLAINRPKMLEEIHYRQGEVVDIPLSPTSWLYDKEQKVHPYQPEEAKEILKQMGWVDTNNNGLVNKEIENKKYEFTFELITNGDNENRKQEAEIIKENLKKVDIGVDIKYLPQEEIIKRIQSKKFQAILTGWNLSFNPDLSFAFHSKEIEEGDNFISYSNAEMDKLFIEALRTNEEEKSKEVYSNIQRKLSQQLPYISLYMEKSALITNNRIKGPISPTDYNIFNNIEQWYVEYK